MNITYLIGNGFDLNLGLKTSYKDFYKEYLEILSDNKYILKFKEQLKDDIENWSDLEKMLGIYTKNFSEEEYEEFINLIDDIQDELANYLKKQEESILFSLKNHDDVYSDLFLPEKYLTEKERSIIESIKFENESYEINLKFIIYNYTNTFEKIIDWKDKEKKLGILNNIYSNILGVDHVHGTVDKDMLMGVNDIEQIANFEFKKNQEIKDAIIKPNMNELTGSYREFKCEKAIEEADIICIFGMSLGETDKKWWELVNKRMCESNALVIIFAKDDSIKQIRYFRDKKKRDDKIKDKLISFNENKNIDNEELKKRIIVCYNSNMLKIDSKVIISKSKEKVA